ncbi:hypothetical protein ACWC4J_40720, partial [Streptomyces sp. NPDC001356]
MTERGPRSGSGRRGLGGEGRPSERRAKGERADGGGVQGERPSGARGDEHRAGGAPAAGPDDRAAALVRIRDLAGRPRGLGFLADHEGTLLTSHEAVDGLPRLVLHAGEDRTCVVGPDAVIALPGLGLALVRTEGLGVEPLPLTVQERID